MKRCGCWLETSVVRRQLLPCTANPFALSRPFHLHGTEAACRLGRSTTATAWSLIAANIHYAQPLIGPVNAALHLAPWAAGFIATMAQVGYGVGLLPVIALVHTLTEELELQA